MRDTPFPTAHIGEYSISALSDGYLPASLDLLVNIAPDDADRLQHHAGRAQDAAMHINCYLIRGGGHTMLVDAGAGGVKGWGGNLTRQLDAAGVTPASIDTILLTHAHPDHAGGLVDASGQPRFPEAELLVHHREVAFWQDDDNLAAANERARGNFAIARTALNAYRNRLQAIDGGELFPGISALPLPGHTSGHTGYLLQAGKDAVLAWGDTVHFPAVQIPMPHASLTLDSDPAHAARTRSAVLARASAERLIVAGAHLNERGFARIERRDGVYCLAPADPLPGVVGSAS